MRFTDALDRKAEDIQRPPVPPAGFYTARVTKHPEVESFTSSRTGEEFDRLQFMFQLVSPVEVDEDELKAFGNPTQATLRRTFLFPTSENEQANFDRSMFNLRRLLTDHLGLSDKENISELLAESVGQQCVVEVTHRPDPNDAEIIYAEIGKTAAED